VIFGLLNVNKPSGPTSHDIVAAVRRGAGERRVGHGGTLDPLASGVLILALGQATRLLEYASGSDKTYRAHLHLGVETDSYDAEGQIVSERPLPPDLDAGRLDAVLDAFRGPIEQVPPVYSAVKVDGKAAYERTRAGEAVQLAPRQVDIHTLRLIEFQPPVAALEVVCSSGTYIRSLAHDIGEALGCGAYLSGLNRTASGSFTLDGSVEWELLRRAFDDGSWQQYLLPPDAVLANNPVVQLSADEARMIANGNDVPLVQPADGLGRAYDPSGRFIAVLEADPAVSVWHPRKVFSQVYS